MIRQLTVTWAVVLVVLGLSSGPADLSRFHNGGKGNRLR